MRYVIHVFILVGSLVAAGVTIMAALRGESSWYGAIIAGVVFGFAAGNLTLLEIRNWVRASGHRQHSRLLRMLAAPVAQIADPRGDEAVLPHDANDERLGGLGTESQPLLPSSETHPDK